MARIFLLLCSLGVPALAQQQVMKPTLVQKVTMTGAFVAVMVNTPGRVGCTMFNRGSNQMFIFFGTTAPADTTSSLPLAAGQSMNCSVGGVGVAIDAVWASGTSGDTLVVNSQ